MRPAPRVGQDEAVTTSTDLGTQTGTRLLYLSADLGNRPRLEDFHRNTAALLTFARYATGVVQPRPESLWLPPIRQTEVQIVRTSLASPWVSVLADLARNSAPIGYGTASLYALHRVLRLVMTWQQHRLDIAERRLHLDELRHALAEEHRRLSPYLPEPSRKAGLGEVGRHRGEEPTRNIEPEVNLGSAVDEQPSEFRPMLSAGLALGNVQAAELISLDDPRVVGD